MQTRQTKSGRIIIEYDGYSEYYNAYEQGAPVFKIGVKAEDLDLALYLLRCRAGKLELKENCNSVIIYKWDKVQ